MVFKRKESGLSCTNFLIQSRMESAKRPETKSPQTHMLSNASHQGRFSLMQCHVTLTPRTNANSGYTNLSQQSKYIFQRQS